MKTKNKERRKQELHYGSGSILQLLTAATQNYRSGWGTHGRRQKIHAASPSVSTSLLLPPSRRHNFGCAAHVATQFQTSKKTLEKGARKLKV
jgi:hypothetical protein